VALGLPRTTVVNVVNGWGPQRFQPDFVTIAVSDPPRITAANVANGWDRHKYQQTYVTTVVLGQQRTIVVNVGNGLRIDDQFIIYDIIWL
jgi:hypothetical protein